MSTSPASRHTASTTIAWAWGCISPVVLYVLMVCSTNHLQTLGVVIVWFAIQIGGNLAAVDLLDDRYRSVPGSIRIIGRSFKVGIALAVMTSPLSMLLPDTTNCL